MIDLNLDLSDLNTAEFKKQLDKFRIVCSVNGSDRSLCMRYLGDEPIPSYFMEWNDNLYGGMKEMRIEIKDDSSLPDYFDRLLEGAFKTSLGSIWGQEKKDTDPIVLVEPNFELSDRWFKCMNLGGEILYWSNDPPKTATVLGMVVNLKEPSTSTITEEQGDEDETLGVLMARLEARYYPGMDKGAAAAYYDWIHEKIDLSDDELRVIEGILDVGLNA